MTTKLKTIVDELETTFSGIEIETEKIKVMTGTALTGYFQNLIPDKMSKNGNYDDNTLIITGFDNNRVFTEIAYESAVRTTELLEKASDLVSKLFDLQREGDAQS